MPEDGYYGRNVLHVLSGLRPFVVVNGKTYVCVDTLIGACGKQIDCLIFIVSPCMLLSHVLKTNSCTIKITLFKQNSLKH
jgi:hypothetical protein